MTLTTHAVYAHVKSNYTYVNSLKDPLDMPQLVLPLPKTAVLQGFAVEGHDLAGDLVLKSDAVLPAKCPSRDSFSFYQASLQGPSYRVPLPSSVEAGAKVVLHLDYVMQLETRQRPGFGHIFALHIALPGSSKDTRPSSGSSSSASGLQSPISIEVIQEGLELEVSTATSSVVVDRRCPQVLTSSSCPYVVQSSVLQDVVLELAMPKPLLHSPASPFLTMQRHPTTGQVAAAIWLPPNLGVAGTSQFEIFVAVDTSVTMRGPRLGRVLRALRSLLRSLPHGIRLNMVGHDANKPSEPIFETSRELDERTFQEVDEYLAREPTDTSTSAVQTAEAVLGAVFECSRPEFAQLRVLLITDRHPPDPKRATQLVEENCFMDCRLFSTGLGWSASPMFVEDAAKET